MTRVEIDELGISVIIDGGSPTKSEATYILCEAQWYCADNGTGRVDQRTASNLNDILKTLMLSAIAKTNKIQKAQV